MSNAILVNRPDDLTVNWAQKIMNESFTGVEVSKVEQIALDVGTTTRVRIRVDHDGPQSIPRCWFVKMPSMAWRARLITALPRLLPTEVRFYQEMAPLIPIHKPAVLAAKSQLGRGSTLVLADVKESGGRPGQTSDELTETQAKSVIDQLAELHAVFWQESVGINGYSWMSGPVRKLEDHLGTALAVPLMKQGLRLANGVVPNSLRLPAMRYARRRRFNMRFLGQGAQTIVHHDCHPGNLFWQQANPGLLDWQMVRTGEGISDIAYLLATSMTPEDRRRHEVALLKHYVGELQNKGINVTLTEMLPRYRAHLVYPFEAMLVTLAVGGMMVRQDNLEMIRRAAAAVEELDAFSELPF